MDKTTKELKEHLGLAVKLFEATCSAQEIDTDATHITVKLVSNGKEIGKKSLSELFAIWEKMAAS